MKFTVEAFARSLLKSVMVEAVLIQNKISCRKVPPTALIVKKNLVMTLIHQKPSTCDDFNKMPLNVPQGN